MRSFTLLYINGTRPECQNLSNILLRTYQSAALELRYTRPRHSQCSGFLCWRHPNKGVYAPQGKSIEYSVISNTFFMVLYVPSVPAQVGGCPARPAAYSYEARLVLSLAAKRTISSPASTVALRFKSLKLRQQFAINLHRGEGAVLDDLVRLAHTHS